MINQTIFHEAKSKWSYVYKDDLLHLRVRVGKGEIDSMEIVAYDSYSWAPTAEDSSEWVFEKSAFLYADMHIEHSDKYFDYWFGEIKSTPALRVRYGFLIESKEESLFFGSKGVVSRKEYEAFNFTGSGESFAKFFCFPYLNYEDTYYAPEWIEDTVWYQIFPNRFNRSNHTPLKEGQLEWNSEEDVNYKMDFGGNIKGMTEKLDYLERLGINGIYMTPIFKAFSTHKYDTEDYFNIDPHFGTNEDFKEFVSEAHKRGIKIVLDGVFNHCGWEHPFWQDVVKNGGESEYVDCFFIRDKSKPIVNFTMKDGRPSVWDYDEMRSYNYETFGYAANMPKWNTGHSMVREYLIAVGKHWIEEYDIDGWRLDVSNEVSHEFWREYKKELTKVKKDIYLVGENWDHSYPWVSGDQFQAVMNYELLYKVWGLLGLEEYVEDVLEVPAFIKSLHSYLVYYPKNILPNMLNMMDSHDTTRIMSIVGEDIRKLKLVYVLQMFMPGGPCIYYGTEVALTGVGQDGNRKCMPWDVNPEQHEMYLHLKNLIEWRNQNPAMKSQNFEWIDVQAQAFSLRKTEGDNTVYLMLNNSDEVVELLNLSGEKESVEPFGFKLFSE